jgi:putative ABC transport system permease protein
LSPTDEQQARRAIFIRSWLERVRALPGVRLAGASDLLPFSVAAGSSVAIVNHPPDPAAPTQIAYQTRVTPGFFKAIGIPLLRGRDFTPGDELGRYAIVDESLVKKFFGNLDPLGQQITLPIARANFTIIGVCGPAKLRDLATPAPARAYYVGPQVPARWLP